MDYTIKGIAFNEKELVSVSLAQLRLNSISRSHLFYFPSSSSRPLLLLRAGDLIESAFIEKYTKKGLMSVACLEVADSTLIDKYSELFQKLKTTRGFKELRVVRSEFLEEIHKDWWKDPQDSKSFLAFIIACHDSFYIFDTKFENEYYNKSTQLYAKSLLAGSVSVLIGLIENYVDSAFLQDLYHICFFMDYGLISNEVDFVILDACEKERESFGSGIEYLKSIKRDVTPFIDHPLVSYDFLKIHKDNLKHQELIDFVKLHHENADGAGFPEGRSYAMMSDAELILSFADTLISFEEKIYVNADIKKLFKDTLFKFENIVNTKYPNMSIMAKNIGESLNLVQQEELEDAS